MYSMGVPVGILVDGKGPRPAVMIGSIILLVGYFPLHSAFDAGHGSVPLLCFFSFLTGLGGCMAFAAAIKAVSHRSSDPARGAFVCLHPGACSARRHTQREILPLKEVRDDNADQTPHSRH
jgi:MFS family permease